MTDEQKRIVSIEQTYNTLIQKSIGRLVKFPKLSEIASLLTSQGVEFDYREIAPKICYTTKKGTSVERGCKIGMLIVLENKPNIRLDTTDTTENGYKRQQEYFAALLVSEIDKSREKRLSERTETQKKILEFIIKNGGSANYNQIANNTNIDLETVITETLILEKSQTLLVCHIAFKDYGEYREYRNGDLRKYQGDFMINDW